MYMNIHRLLYSAHSRLVISLLIGFGLATLFRKSCTNKKCLKFVSPSANRIKNKVYEFDNEYYKFVPKSVMCDPNKKTIPFA